MAARPPVNLTIEKYNFNLHFRSRLVIYPQTSRVECPLSAQLCSVAHQIPEDQELN